MCRACSGGSGSFRQTVTETKDYMDLEQQLYMYANNCGNNICIGVLSTILEWTTDPDSIKDDAEETKHFHGGLEFSVQNRISKHISS